MKTIPDKKTFKALSNKGILGNRFRTFATVEDAYWSGVPCFYIRGPVAGWPHMVQCCPVAQLDETVARIERKGTPRSQMQFVEVKPDGTPRTINAEILRGEQGLWLRYGSSSVLNLRHDLEQNGIHAQGIKAKQVMWTRMPQEDVDMVDELLDDWPGAIIEFSTYEQRVGIFDRYTVIWEVRHY